MFTRYALDESITSVPELVNAVVVMSARATTTAATLATSRATTNVINGNHN